MSQMPFKPTQQQIDCANKTGFNVNDLDPMSMSNTMGMNRDKFNKCMEENKEGKVIPISKQAAEKEDLILGLKPLHFGLAALGVAIATYFVYKNFKKTGTKKVIN